MTYLLGWSTHRISAAEWQAMASLLERGNVTITHDRGRFNPRCVPFRSLVDSGIAEEYPVSDGQGYELTRDGKRFAETFCEEYAA